MQLVNKFPNVPLILPPKGQIPSWYRSRAREWSFSEDCLRKKILIENEWIKPMLTFDLNLSGEKFAADVNRFEAGSREAHLAFGEGYECTLDCALCFNKTRLRNKILTSAEVFGVLDQARPMGLRSAKFLGPGELLEKKELWKILDYTRRHNIILGIFTKAAVLGNDWLAEKYHGVSSRELLERLLQYENVNYYLEGRSFDPVWENRFIPIRDEEDKKHVNYYEALCVAYEALCGAGLNSDLRCQRMTVQCNPVTHQTLSGVFEIYQWAAERNMPAYLPPTMASGKGHLGEKSALDELYFERYINLAFQVYTWAIERGIMTLEQLRYEGVHPYLGTTPCNQLTHGLYMHADGQIWRCPGNDTDDFVVCSDVRKHSLKDIWVNSKNYRINAFNNHCVKDGVSLPFRFYTEVEKRVEQHFSS